MTNAAGAYHPSGLSYDPVSFAAALSHPRNPLQ